MKFTFWVVSRFLPVLELSSFGAPPHLLASFANYERSFRSGESMETAASPYHEEDASSRA